MEAEPVERRGRQPSEGARKKDLHSYSQSRSPVALLKRKAPPWPLLPGLPRAVRRSRLGKRLAAGPGDEWDEASHTGSPLSGSQHFCCCFVFPFQKNTFPFEKLFFFF